MFFRSILQSWLQNAAKTKLQQTLLNAAGEKLKQSAQAKPAEPPKACRIGVVFAMGIESGCFEDRLDGLITVRGGGFTIRQGGLRGRPTAIIIAGPGRQNAARATETLITGHHPQLVISAGFAGGLSPSLKRNDILIADRVLTSAGPEITLDPPPAILQTIPPGVHRGPLLSLDRVVRLPSDRRALFERFGAMAVDMETIAVAKTCRQFKIPFLSVRIINDTHDETLPKDVEHLLNQKNAAAQWGAALGAVWRRPASAKDIYQLRENALVASTQLARFLSQMV